MKNRRHTRSSPLAVPRLRPKRRMWRMALCVACPPMLHPLSPQPTLSLLLETMAAPKSNRSLPLLPMSRTSPPPAPLSLLTLQTTMLMNRISWNQTLSLPTVIRNRNRDIPNPHHRLNLLRCFKPMRPQCQKAQTCCSAAWLALPQTAQLLLLIPG